MAKTTTPRVQQTRWSSGNDTFSRLDFDADAASLEQNVGLFKEGTLAERPAAGVTGRWYTVKGDATPAHNGKRFYDNGANWQTERYANDFVAESTSNAATALVVKAKESPTAPIFTVGDATSLTPFLSVGADGSVLAGNNLFGTKAGHVAGMSVPSVAADKPALLVKSAAGQTADIVSIRNNSDAVVSSVSPNGNGFFAGSVSASSASILGGVVAASVSITGSSALKNLTVTPAASTSVPVTIRSYPATQSANLLEVINSGNTKVARINDSGDIATSGRLISGNGNGDLTSQSYGPTTAQVWVKNMSADAPALRINANTSGQTAPLFEAADPSNVVRFSVTAAGGLFADGNVSARTLSVGAGNVSPSLIYSDPTIPAGNTIPAMETITGTEDGAYSQTVVVRHATNSAERVSRTVGLHLKMSSESTAIESAKFAGIAARSEIDWANKPSLIFYAGGVENASLTAVGDFTVKRNANIPGKIVFGQDTEALNREMIWYSGSGYMSTGLQGNVLYNRAGGGFAWYTGGSYNPAAYNAGGGTLAASLTSAGVLTTGSLVVEDTTAFNSNTPALSIGARNGNHMQFSTQSINSYSGSASVAANVQGLSIANNGGLLTLGNSITPIYVTSRMLIFGHQNEYRTRFWVSGGAMEMEIDGGAKHGDFWFDPNTASIKWRTSTNTWKTIAA